MDLHGKNVLITGSARRIGREIAIKLARSGACLLLHYNHSESQARSLKKEIESLSAKALLFRCDLSPRGKPLVSTLQTFFKQLNRAVPRIDILINNASVFYPTPFGKITEKDWDHFMTVNLKAPFFLSQAVGQRMLRQKSGKIINLLDAAVSRPQADYLPYAISKAGLWTATAGLAKALAPYVQVNGIAPGPILPSKGMTPRGRRAIVKKTLLKRFGHPEDIAEAVRFLIEGTDFITGTVIPVDGGMSHV
ncbi:MAG TPA: SDR family oxidoreductase [bacterium]|nr:SDR family oxidoreductase [bacterium]